MIRPCALCGKMIDCPETSLPYCGICIQVIILKGRAEVSDRLLKQVLEDTNAK